ncbi:uncharacterized protein LOC142472889 isoform X2 [Ascaphus truei]|uniref:uncharacterized protein LOC142472889 isoform X2 n=1 Tax=Ascaphus truei TaxID=8439 RepID=UPI003F59C6B9
MSACSCLSCCFTPSEEDEDENTPFARLPKGQNPVKDLNKHEKLVLKNVNVTEIDQMFADITDTYNKQLELHQGMEDAITKLADTSHSPPSCLPGAYIEVLKKEHDDCDIKVKIEGYNFSLLVNAAAVPENLKQAQEHMKNMSRATKGIIGNQTKLQEMIFSMLQSKTQMADRIKQGNPGYLDQVRLQDNLEENIQKIDQAKQLSKQYAEGANNVLRNIAEIAGVSL